MIELVKDLNERTCCLCLSDEESQFTSNSMLKSLPLRDMVNFSIGIQLKHIAVHNESISRSICNECVLKVSDFYSFKKKIIEAQSLLESLIDVGKEPDEPPPIADQEEEEEDEEQMVEEHLRSPMHEHEAETDEDAMFIDDNIHQQSSSESANHQEPSPTRTKKTTNRNRSREPKSETKKSKQSTTGKSERITLQMNECLICPSVLNDCLQLEEHVSAHTETKCKVCTRSFARYSNLKRHFMATHSKPKPFQCDLCGLGFSFSVNLQAHAALHYSGKIRVK